MSDKVSNLNALISVPFDPDEMCRHCGAFTEDDGDHSCPCPHPDDTCQDHPTPSREADRVTGDAETLAEVIWEASRADESTVSAIGAQHVARAVLASDWLAAVRDEAAREAGAKVGGHDRAVL